MKALVAVALLSAAATGCTSVITSTVETGLFENNPEKIVAAYENLEKRKLGDEIITFQDLEHLGFNLKAPNVETVPGTFALKRIFGDAVFRDKNGVEKPDINLEEFSKYRGYSIPYQRIEITSDRIYLSELEVLQKGSQVQIFLLLKQDKLCYCDLRAVTIDTRYSHYALLEGLIVAIRNPGKAALNTLKKLEEYQRPGLKFFVPIPID